MPAKYPVHPTSEKHTVDIQVKAKEVEKLIYRISQQY